MLVQSLAKVTLLLKYSVKLRHCILCGDVAACHEMACVLFVVQTAACTTNSKHAIFSKGFRKILNIKLHKNLSIGSRIVPYGRTDIMKIIVYVRNFVNAPKNMSLSNAYGGYTIPP